MRRTPNPSALPWRRARIITQVTALVLFLALLLSTRGGEYPDAPPGLFYYMLAKTFAILGNAKSCAHYLKMSRDEGYKKYTEALKDPAFKTVLKDPRVQAILVPQPQSADSTATVVTKVH